MQHKLKKLADQIIVITGATSGIGLSTARLAAKRGAHVVLVARNKPELQRVCGEIQRQGGECMGIVGDISVETDVKDIADIVKDEFGRIDTWINNAGLSLYGSVLDTNLEEDRRLFDVNYWGVVHGSRAAIAAMSETGGALINLGSVLSDRVIPLQAQYCASKHAVKAFTDAVRMDVEKRRIPISVTLIKPSAINTPFTEHARNHMNKKATLPPPIYDPQVAARAILFCAEHPRRDVYVGSGGPILYAMETLFPRLTDRIMEKFFYRLQRDKTRPKTPVSQESLFQVPESEGRERGDYQGYVMKSSLYTAVSLRTTPLLVAAAGAAAIGAVVLLRARASSAPKLATEAERSAA